MAQEATASVRPTPRRLSRRLGVKGWVYAGRYPLERYLYTLHRIAGLGLMLYLPLHVWVTGQRLKGPEVWERTMAALSTPVFRFGEFLVLAAFLFHALNGIRLLLGHLGYSLGRPATPVYPYPVALHRQRPLTSILMILAGVLIAVGLWEIVVG
ncbi:MAG: succinate dehydrogenase, cytochrome b556 subunit [Limnochordaceae bacterium]|uniref:Succinate dehydrogenase, cytochrome b556 subunit n=1 Tax=Carboxydichorda subterranea TaxID=3109565 RepID=A0ABZ1BYZ5_9FIRM|nr:succinate dehydrogenase, cytochrome b556 subunit [Limnochorda sp. L945t]MBE3598672.1 succinate dehydrogenase, cytochrome b556 subunit [Limnochordaceae bacterium]WRP18055.1 succinate dehydrogenase, cytochrome b556 subunit [Limnochorda sp. L945t]